MLLPALTSLSPQLLLVAGTGWDNCCCVTFLLLLHLYCRPALQPTNPVITHVALWLAVLHLGTWIVLLHFVLQIIYIQYTGSTYFNFEWNGGSGTSATVFPWSEVYPIQPGTPIELEVTVNGVPANSEVRGGAGRWVRGALREAACGGDW